ncbi:hypothetical protein LINGRAHAP2_LOCUS23909 [Linum grandiflorum]
MGLASEGVHCASQQPTTHDAVCDAGGYKK